MSAVRRTRGTRVKPKALGYEVEEESKLLFEAVARKAGMSNSMFFEQMVTHMDLTEQGIPPWVPPLNRDGELPIDSA